MANSIRETPYEVLARALTIARGLKDADTDNADLNDLRELAEQGCMMAELLCQCDAMTAGLLKVLDA